MFGSGMNFVTTVIGFGMSATFIVFVCTRIICGRIRGAQSRHMLQTVSRIDLEQPEEQIRGLDPAVVAAIPTMKFNREAFSSIEDAQCSICLGEYQAKEVLRIMPKCGHNFHRSCIDVWLIKQSTCPVCRLPLQELSKLRPCATFRMTQSLSLDSPPETSTQHSRQWPVPVPGSDPCVSIQINQLHHDSATPNSGIDTGQAET